jgi:hypothetical protein
MNLLAGDEGWFSLPNMNLRHMTAEVKVKVVFVSRVSGW